MTRRLRFGHDALPTVSLNQTTAWHSTMPSPLQKYSDLTILKTGMTGNSSLQKNSMYIEALAIECAKIYQAASD